MSTLLEWLQDRVFELIRPFRDFKTIWKVRIEASRALLDLEFHSKGIGAALSLFIKYLEEEPSLRGLHFSSVPKYFMAIFLFLCIVCLGKRIFSQGYSLMSLNFDICTLGVCTEVERKLFHNMVVMH